MDIANAQAMRSVGFYLGIEDVHGCSLWFAAGNWGNGIRLILGEIWGRGECLGWFYVEGGLDAPKDLLVRHENDIDKRQSAYISDAYAWGAGDSEKHGISKVRECTIRRDYC